MLNAPRNVLIQQADLEEETVDDLIRVLKAEFEDEDFAPATAAKEETPAQPEAEATPEEANEE